MNALIIVNKEKGLTSHDVVNKIRKIFNTKKVGHLGTLDPNATGVLLICLNEATKLVKYINDARKEYLAEIILGISTDTDDITGNVINTTIITPSLLSNFDEVINSFLGKSLQKPPIYSAIKKNGKKLYEYARENINIEIDSRWIEILSINRIDEIYYKDGQARCHLKIECSKGTYIRALCRDIGEKLGVPSTMGDLVRTRSGKFIIEEASFLSDIENNKFKAISMLDALNLKTIDISDNIDLIKKTANGMKISINTFSEMYDEIAFKIGNDLRAIYILTNEQGHKYYKADRVWK